MDTDPKEILGFDPETEEYTAGSGEEKLKPLPLQGEQRDSVPREVQDSFRDFINRRYLVRPRLHGQVVPEKLFFVHKDSSGKMGDSYERQYYHVPFNHGFREEDLKSTLRITEDKTHDVNEGEVSIRHIILRKYSELQKEKNTWEGFELHSSIFSDKDSFEVVNIKIQFQGRRLEIGYKAGEFWHAYISPEDQGPGVGISMKELNKRGLIKSPKHEAVFDKDEGTISLKREESGLIADEVILPSRINFQIALNNLIPKPILENPYEAPPELDNQWKEVDLKHHFGIDWQRPN